MDLSGAALRVMGRDAGNVTRFLPTALDDTLTPNDNGRAGTGHHIILDTDTTDENPWNTMEGDKREK